MAIENLGFIGLGVMGSGQSQNVTKKSGLPVHVFDMNPDTFPALEAVGATVSESIKDIAQIADVIFMSMPGEPQCRAVLLGPDGVFENAKPGTIIVDLSTIPLRWAQEAGKLAKEHGMFFLDCPVTRTKQAAYDGTLSITVGGDREAFDRVEKLISTMATDVLYCGENGAGALMKLLNNMIVFETVVALSEAITLVRKSGIIDPELAFTALGNGSAASFTLENHGKKSLLLDDHQEGKFPTTYMYKDVGYFLEAAEDLGVEVPQAKEASALLKAVIDAGYVKEYHTAVVRAIEGKI